MFHPTRLLFLTATFFCGLAYAFIFPLMSLYLIVELESTPMQMGIFLAVMVSAGILVSTYIARKSDQGWRRKRIIIVSQASFALAMLVLILTRSYSVAMLTAVTLMSVNAATLPQIFTLGRLYSEYEIAKGGALFMSLLRASIAVAWVIGPPMGFLLKERYGFNVAFASGIVSALVMFAIVPLLPEYQARAICEKTRATMVKWYKSPAIVLFLFSCLFMFSASSMYNTAIPLYVTKTLMEGGQWAGYLMGLAAFIEIPFMVLAGIFGPKIGNRRLILLGLLSGALFYVGLLLTSDIAMLLALQLFNGVFVAIIATLGLLLIQDLMKHELGLGTTLFTGAQQLSSLVSALLIGGIAQYYGYYAVFIGCLVLVGLSFVFLLFVKEEPVELESEITSEQPDEVAERI